MIKLHDILIEIANNFKKDVLYEASINYKGNLLDIGNDLVIEFTPEYFRNEEDYKFFYCEKGLADGFKIKNGKKVKEIIGYSNFLNIPENKRWVFKLSNPADELGIDDDDCSDAEESIIGYIYLKSDKDIEIEYDEDELQELFYDALGITDNY